MNSEIENGRRVTESALIERINERLLDESHDRKEMQMIGSPSIGNFYEHSNELTNRAGAVDLESIGRELGVLAPDETIAHCTTPQTAGSES